VGSVDGTDEKRLLLIYHSKVPGDMGVEGKGGVGIPGGGGRKEVRTEKKSA